MRLRLLLAILLPVSAHAQSRDSIITGSATRSTRIAPDRISMYVVAEGTAEGAPEAVTKAEAKFKAVMDALKPYGTRLQVDPPFDYSVNPVPLQNGYNGMPTAPSNVARTVARLQLNQPAQLGQVIATALAAGASTTTSLLFESSVADSVRRARIGEALAAAKADAQALATALGGRLGPLVSISTSGAFGYQNPPQLSFDNRYVQGGPAPEITVTTSVSVEYRLIR